MKNISKAGPTSGLMNNEQAAAYLRIWPNTLNGWRSPRLQEIPYIKVGHRVFYKREALDGFLDSQTIGVAATG